MKENNEILQGYSQEEIENLAIKQLQSNNQEKENILKIAKIDREYKNIINKQY